MVESISMEQAIESLKEAYLSGCPYLLITSRRQDIGIHKCEMGVIAGYLRYQEVNIDDQETHWRYYWTEKAKEEWDDHPQASQ